MTGPAPDWIAVDWGTTHLRLWQMAADGTVLTRIDDDRGVNRLHRDDFAPTLAALAPAGPARMPVVICGMAGSRQGWAEAPYAAVPCAPPGIAQATALQSGAFDAHILPGVRQDSPADVMRGEETQIAGFLAHHPGFDGVLCLPGTHTKWVHLSAGEIVSFRTFMTGELFALLSQQSVLRHCIADEGWDDAAFSEALGDIQRQPVDLAARLFSLRADRLLHDLAPQSARARLSGLLIGSELVAARPFWLGQNVVVAGSGGFAQAYQTALDRQGVQARAIDADPLTLAGLGAAYQTLTRTS